MRAIRPVDDLGEHVAADDERALGETAGDHPVRLRDRVHEAGAAGREVVRGGVLRAELVGEDRAVEGNIMSGVTVATMIRSTSDASTPACSSACVAAGSARSESASSRSGDAALADPVRSRIHSSEVSTIFASSSFVITRSGTCEPMPVIETWPFDVALPITPAPRRTSAFRARRAGRRPSRVALPLPIGPRTRSRSHVELELVARLDDPLEAHVVDAGEEREPPRFSSATAPRPRPSAPSPRRSGRPA